jgi:phosphopantothenoylcysteine decarboxylase/phosphopantothenate--cysteine ligase
LVANPDILFELVKSEVRKPKLIVGFAAESQDLIKNAKQKLENKKLDLIVANDISADDAGFEVETNRVTLLDKSGKPEKLPLMSKDEVASIVLARVVDLLK